MLLCDLADDDLELIFLKLADADDVIAVASAARRCRVICNTRWQVLPCQRRTAIEAHWEDVRSSRFSWRIEASIVQQIQQFDGSGNPRLVYEASLGTEIEGVVFSSYEVFVVQSRLHERPAVAPLDLQRLPDVSDLFVGPKYRRMNGLQRAKLWEGTPTCATSGTLNPVYSDSFDFSFELRYNDKPVASWNGPYTEGFYYELYYDEGNGFAPRLDVPLFDPEDFEKGWPAW